MPGVPPCPLGTRARRSATGAPCWNRRTRLEQRGLHRYDLLLTAIAKRYRGVAVGDSESIVAPLAHALGLRLPTPSSFLDAISEGTKPTAADLATVDRQIAGRQIEAWIYNRQNSTPDVARLTDAARKRGIPIVSITETLVPASATFQDWQARELEALSPCAREGDWTISAAHA